MAGYWVTTIHWTLQQHRQQGKGVVEDASLMSPNIVPITEEDDEMSVTSEESSAHHHNEDSAEDQKEQRGRKPQRRPVDPWWWKPYIEKLARPWTPRTIRSWCREDFHVFPPGLPFLLGYKKVAKGMIYIKVYKASSSTCEGIARSIAHHVGTRYWQKQQLSRQKKKKFQINKALMNAITYHNNTSNNHNHTTNSSTSITCRAWTRHEFANSRMQARRDLNHSLLWTFVRNPAARDLSHIYHFEVGRNGRTNMTSKDIQDQIQLHLKGFQTRYLVANKTQPTPLWPLHELRRNRTKVINILNRAIFQNFDFIGLTERMNESLACMVLLWNLHPQDVIVLNAKRSGGYDDGGGEGHACTKIPKVPSPLDPTLQEYFTKRHPMLNADMLLYHAANASLELTMDVLGRDKVYRMTQYIEQLQQIAQRECEDQAYFPCSPEGVYQPTLSQQSCYVQDSGCGYECIHRVLANITVTTMNLTMTSATSL